MNHFDWSFSDGSPGITTLPVPITVPATPQTSIQHTFTGEGVYVATLTAYNNFGCSSVCTNEIYLIPLPTATAGGSQTICSNSSATVSGASSLNGTIFWTHNGVGNITNGQGTLSPTYTSVIEDAGNTVTLTMTVSSTYTLACSPPAIATFTIFVNPSSINTTNASAFNSYFWNGTTYYTSGVYTVTTANCVTESLNLTITNPAQSCTPGANFADSTFGFWPSTATNFPPASIGCSYSTNINFMVPSTITEEIVAVIPEAVQFLGSPISSYTITSVTGLPSGFLYVCNISSCQYNGGSNGCANIYGTTSAPAGSYPVSIEVDITILISLFPGSPPIPFTQSITFDGYSIELGSAGNTTTSVTSCGSYTWNGTTYTSSGVYTGTTTNCITEALNLTITPPSSTNTTTATSCDSYTWNGTSYSESGVYTGTTTNCVTESLNLTIQPSAIDTILGSVCSGFPFIWNNQSYSTSGNYTQTFQAANGCDSNVTLNLTVFPTNFNPTFSSNQQLFTSPPFAVQFSNTTINLSNYTFTWYWGDGTSTTSNNPTVFHEYLSNGLYSVTLEAVNNVTGCLDQTTLTDYIFTTGGVSCSHSSVINQVGPINGCSSQPIIITCNSDPNFTYQWRRNGVYIQGNNNDTLLVNQPGSYSVIISVNGCPVSSLPVVVNIANITAPTISSSGAIQPCIGGSVILSVSLGYTNYLWSNGATTQSITVSSSGNFSVQGTGANGCIATSQPYNVNASFLPTQNICVVGVDSMTNNIRVVWEKPLTTAIDSFYVYKESTVSNVYTQVGTRAYDSLSVWIDPISNPAVQAYRYKITALDTCGVETPLSDLHKTIHLTINQGVGGAWNLIWSNYEGINFGSYKIYRGTSTSNMSLLTSIQSNLNSYTDLTPPSGLVYYQIEIINPNNCSPTKSINYSSSKSNITSNGQNDLLVITSDYISIFPNPTTSKITVKSSLELIGKEYIIYDQLGKEVMSGIITSEETEIDLSNISEGVYLFKVGTDMQESFKIIKQ